MSRRSEYDLYGGVGINDSPHVVVKAIGPGKLWVCEFYSRWVGMINRCYNDKFLEKSPWYRGCTVSDEWLRFSKFYQWMSSQDWRGKHLDKDILIPGNKVYREDACVFVSPELNSFLTSRRSARGPWPLGVVLQKDKGRFIAKCKNPFTGRNDYLGGFSCPDLAHEAWRARKHEHALAYAAMQTDLRISQALKTRFDSSTRGTHL